MDNIFSELQNNVTTRVSRESFHVMNLLGKGKFGKVFKVRKVHGHNENKIYAMKIVKKKMVIHEDKKSALSEKNALRTSDHPFIIKLIYSFQTASELYYILEYASGGNFHSYLINKGRLSETSASFYIKQLILAVEYLHARNIVHRDIKPGNILLDCNGFIKLADFGLCKKQFINQKLYTVCGTDCYMAPEIFQESGYGREVDWWSTGILLYQMLVGKIPVFSNFKNMIKDLQKCEYGALPRFVSPAARNLIELLLEVDVRQRLGSNGANEIKDHVFFLNTSWETIFYQLEAPPFVPKHVYDIGVSMLGLFIKSIFGWNLIDNNEIDEKYNYLFQGFTYTYDTMKEIPLAQNFEHRVKIYGVDRLLSNNNKRENFLICNIPSRIKLYWNRIRNIIIRSCYCFTLAACSR